MRTVTYHQLGARVSVQPWAPGGASRGELVKIGTRYVYVRDDAGEILTLYPNEIIRERRFRKDSDQ